MGIVDDLARRQLRGELDANSTALVAVEQELETRDTALATMGQNYDTLTERIAELELAREDSGWLQLGGESWEEFSRDGLATITYWSRLFYLKNPLIRRGVDVQSHYVWGRGMTVNIKDDDINEVIQAFRDDDKNKVEFTSRQAQMSKERELQTDGNLFFVLFTNEHSGQVRVRSIPFNEIADVIRNPEDNKEPWYYKRSYVREGWTPGTGSTFDQQTTEYFPDWKYHPKKKPTSIDDKPIHWDRPVYHVKTGGFSDWKFGVSEVYAAIDWAKAYKEFLEDWASITRSYRRFAWKATGMKSKGEIAAVKSKLGSTYASGGGTGAETTPPPVTGSIAMLTEGRDLQPVRTAGATVAAEDGRHIKLMVCAAMGLPETFFGDVSVGTLATAKSLNRPTELQMVSRQTLWGDIYAEIFNYVLMQQVKTTGGQLRGKGVVETVEQDGKTEYKLVWNDDVESKVDIDFPPIVEEDIDELISAIVDAATLKGSGLAGTIGQRELTRMLLVALHEEDIDETLEAMYPDNEEEEQVTWEEETAQAIASKFEEGLEKMLRKHAD